MVHFENLLSLISAYIIQLGFCCKKLTQWGVCINIPTIGFMLVFRIDINSKTEYGETALIFASRIGQTQIVEVLLQNDADINESDRYGRTALMYAAWQVV